MWKKEKKQETQEVSPEKEEGRDLYEWAQALVCSVLAVVLLFTFVIRLIGVDGHSMVPTLQDGDRLLVLNAMLDNDYEYGDIVVLRKDTFLEEPIVKRVIATEGQTVDIDFVSGAVYVDGELLEEAMRLAPTILVHTKGDLPFAPVPFLSLDPMPPAVILSARTGQGLRELEEAVAALFPRREDVPYGQLLTNQRQAEAAGRALDALVRAREALEAGVTPDALLTDVEQAMAALGELTGQNIREDIVARIFSKFCVGK